MGAILSVIGQILLTYLPRIAAGVMSSAPVIAALSVLAIALSAGVLAVNAAQSGLESVAGAYNGKIWCALSACGGTQLLYWFVCGLVTSLSYVVAMRIKVATASAASRIASSIAKG